MNVGARELRVPGSAMTGSTDERIGRKSYRHLRRANSEGNVSVCLRDSELAGVTGMEFRASGKRED